MPLARVTGAISPSSRKTFAELMVNAADAEKPGSCSTDENTISCCGDEFRIPCRFTLQRYA